MLPPVEQVIEEFEQARRSGADRATAEVAYALAFRMMDAGNYEEARRYARESLAAAERLSPSTVDDVATTRLEVGGVPLPDYFHDGVVRARLGGLLD